MGWKDEVRNGPIQTLAAIVALIGTLVSAGVYVATRSDSSDKTDTLPAAPPFVDGDLPAKLPAPPFSEGEAPPKISPPPFLEGKLPPFPSGGGDP